MAVLTCEHLTVELQPRRARTNQRLTRHFPGLIRPADIHDTQPALTHASPDKINTIDAIGRGCEPLGDWPTGTAAVLVLPERKAFDLHWRICRHCSLSHGWYAAELIAQRSNPGQQHALASIAHRSCEFKAFARRAGGADGEACRHGHACGAEMQYGVFGLWRVVAARFNGAASQYRTQTKNQYRRIRATHIYSYI